MKTLYNAWVLIELVVAAVVFLLAPASSKASSWADSRLVFFAFGDGPHSQQEWLDIGLLSLFVFILYIWAVG